MQGLGHRGVVSSLLGSCVRPVCRGVLSVLVGVTSVIPVTTIGRVSTGHICAARVF